jgi:hypothetical protein
MRSQGSTRESGEEDMVFDPDNKLNDRNDENSRTIDRAWQLPCKYIIAM